MPSPKKSKSPARARTRARSKSASRSRSRSSGRKTKATAAKVTEVKEVVRTSSRIPTRRSTSKSPSRVRVKESSEKSVVTQSAGGAAAAASTVTETVVTRRTYVSSGSSEGQQKASVTPVRSSSRIASLIEKEREESSRIREQMKSEVMANIKTPEKSDSEERKPKEKAVHYEFMGPIGAFLLIFLLPLTVYYVNMACRKGNCSVLVIPKLPRNIVAAFLDVEVTLIFLAWIAFQALLAVLPIGRVVEGQPLKSGGRLKYRCNGFIAFVITLLTLGAAVYFKCPVTLVVDKFFKYMTAAVLFSFTLSICLYVSSFLVNKKKLASTGTTGNHIYDFFIGRELNPRIGPLDLKFFFELRPGLIGWVVLDWIMVVKAYQETGVWPPNLILATFFQTLYVADALWFEDAILTTMDIIHDGFGFMLAFGDLAWVPFLYSLQPRFLLESGFTLPWYCLAPIALLNFVGFAIFRMSNSQKNLFRKDPKNPALAGIETLPTQSGKKLLVGGWWGLCRKPNYLGDLIMALSWSLCTGFHHIIPYFYPLYFLVLLVHRERRDNEQCQQKHGAAWDRYCERVKYRIFPYIY
ncbi:delta(14)-sterol reductase TM7SF2 [Aplysia californica]|uniref:Delta(14)-sterol reductase TM7SF2 n=1 Tax=Aplysia californica TaxID=6500 RepID=A0ABM0K803_APLCA|nr:delta(14)-sterol reductase TM7SF2 [Aplysia californica]XP_005110969.1 delta(14)-sterol reductase TM7SF2 [Aplysia californica]XP_035828938.1 delta(14)-sterol reductase TM7SF2 [Aplysia californica]